jgi:hypothetical protein
MLKAVISALDDIDDGSEEAVVNDDYDDNDRDVDNDDDTLVALVVDDELGNTVETESIMEIVSEETNGVSADIIDTVSADIRDMAVTAEVEDNEWWGEEDDSDPLVAVASLSVTIIDDDDDVHDHDDSDGDSSNDHMNNMNNDSIDKRITPSSINLSSSSPSSSSTTTTTITTSRSVNSAESHLHQLMTKSSNNKSSCSINNSSSDSSDSSSSSAYGKTSTIVRTISSGKQGRFNRPKYSSNPASLSTSVGLTCNLKNHR